LAEGKLAEREQASTSTSSATVCIGGVHLSIPSSHDIMIVSLKGRISKILQPERSSKRPEKATAEQQEKWSRGAAREAR
jgi:hypothetical protein